MAGSIQRPIREAMQSNAQNPEAPEGSQPPETTAAPATAAASAASTAASNVKRQKSHQRASVACSSCRDRRIRCVVPQGQTECTQCKRNGVECIIKNDDERRRPISRAYMTSLTDRVNLLESMLKERGTDPPPAQHPPKVRNSVQGRNEGKSPPDNGPSISSNENSSPGSQHDDSAEKESSRMQNEHQSLQNSSNYGPSIPPSFPTELSNLKKDGSVVSKLLSTRGHLSFDQLSGRLRYFGPTTNCHVLTELGNESRQTFESLEQTRRAEKIIRFLPIETYEYLMEMFWQYYNSVLHVLHQDAFNEDREQGRSQFYSSFLHICVLAMGFRCADKTRPDISRLSLPQGESTLHREAKYMLDYELERPGGIPSVVAMLILGDLECGVGRDNVGWLYAGMAVRLAFDIGLHLDTRNSGLPQREVEIRHVTLWACVIYDKYWALFLGRPTSMKSSDLEIYSLAQRFERLGACRPAGPQKSLETQIYEALLDLMELAGKITENMDQRLTTDMASDRNAYLRMASLDREMNNWYSRLPTSLKWTPENIRNAPFSFFLLHQQFHSALILLHRPFAMYEEPNHSDSENSSSSDDHFSALSRIVCTKNAIRVAMIFWQHRQRFDTKKIFVTALQHAGTAAIALAAAAASTRDPADRAEKMQYLECLGTALQDMALTYQPAQRMSFVLQTVISELRSSAVSNSGQFGNQAGGPVVPARRGSSNDEGDPVPFKKRQTSRGRTARKQHESSSINPDTNASTKQISSSPSQQRRRPFENETERQEDFIVVSPHNDTFNRVNGTTGESNCSDVPFSTPNGNSLAAATESTSQQNRNHHNTNDPTWMAPDPDSEAMAQLASIHFPEIPSITGHGTSQFDFVDPGQEDWRQWQMANAANGLGSDLDGMPTEDKFVSFPVSPGSYGVMMGEMMDE